jgi:two-component sensor histidine kinase
MATVVLALGDLERSWIAALAVAVALALTVTYGLIARREPERLLGRGFIATELACGLSIVVVDGWAYGHGHVFGSSQTLGVIWPLIGVLSAGVALGPFAGALAGGMLGPARVLDALANGVGFGGHRVLSVVSTAFVYGACGAVLGYITRLLREAREQVAVAKASEEVARTLHDGVLQTLAVIERRTSETDIARLAREQERELRRYLFEDAQATKGAPDLRAALDAAVARFEANFDDGRAEVLFVDDLPSLSVEQVGCLAGAVGEALVNAGKHGHARRVTVYVEPNDSGGGVFCSVKDDGAGFDTAAVTEGVGVTRSIRGRLEGVGGRAEIRSSPGDGTEVCMWLP